MRRIKLTVAYDGTAYKGWQLQPNGVTIEEMLNKALSDLLKEPVCVIGASRTDSGVHARGNVAVFDTESRIPGDKFCYAVNRGLPEDIRVVESEEVPLDWHPRKQNCVKTYEYQILNCKIEIPTRRLYAHFCYYPLNVEKMNEAAKYLIGEHDFISFCAANHQAEETVRTIYGAEVKKNDEDIVTIRLCGSGFLYNMVRIIAGTLLKVGTGEWEPEHVKEVLEARNRKEAGQTAPAKGLTLVGIEYEREIPKEIIGRNEHWDAVLDQSKLESDGISCVRIRFSEPEELPRLIRRMVRDARTRGASAKHTISMWPSVRRGEDQYIFPFQEEADVMFNSALIYELAVLKPYAESILFGIPKDVPEYVEAKRLLKFLDYFIGVSTEEIPKNSLMREFVGGSIFRV